MRDRERNLYCAIIEPFMSNARDGWNCHLSHIRSYWDNSVFSKIAKGVKDIKRMRLTSGTGWPCHIRLQSFNDSTGVLRYIVKDNVKPMSSITVDVGVIADREFDLLRLRGGFTAGFEKRELPKEIVQTSSKIIKEITSEKTKVQIRDFDHLHPDDVPLIFSIEVGSDNTWMLTVKNFEGIVETLQVFFRPANLQHYVLARGHVLKCPRGEESGQAEEVKNLEGHEICVPAREEFERNLKKAALLLPYDPEK